MRACQVPFPPLVRCLKFRAIEGSRTNRLFVYAGLPHSVAVIESRKREKHFPGYEAGRHHDSASVVGGGPNLWTFLPFDDFPFENHPLAATRSAHLPGTTSLS
jgi:hypothetical protein